MKVLVRNAHDNFRLFCACLSLLMVGVTNAYAQANPRFSEVDPVSKEVTVTNYGDQAIDLSSYWLCLGGGTYVMIGDVSPVSGAINLMPDASVTLPYNFLQAASGGLGLYNSSSFLSAAAMDDYVQWGAGGAQRESIAVMASLWVAGEFVDTPSPYVYTGDGSQNGLSAWNAVVDGGTLTGGPFEFCVGDGVADNIADGAITLTGNVGSVSQWVITDEQGTILGLPDSFTGPNFDGAGAGTCLVWHLSHDGSLGGAAMGANATTDLTGNYDLSNPISVIRYQPKGGTLTGGPFEFVVGDGVADNIAEGAIELTGNEGGNSQWVVTDETGTILGLPPTPNVVNFDVAGAGTCLIWHLSFDGDLEGAEAGNNAMTDLVGCYSLSNSVTVVRTAADLDGGTLTGGPFEFCVDGVSDQLGADDIVLSGNVGLESVWVITDEELNILGTPPSFTVPDFDAAGVGVCLVWHLSHDGSLGGADVPNANVSDLTGNYSLSNSVKVTRVAGSDCEALSIGDFNTGLPFSVYPVPARTKLQIQLEEVNASNEITLEVYDLLGKKVMQERTLGVSIALDVSKLQLGSYILAIDNGQGAKATKMFTVIQ